MKYEVEMKFPVVELGAIESRLSSMGVRIAAPVAEVDVYFAHPSRDFAVTDEAVRIRRKERANFLTYKGPKIDATTKTRHEIELPLAPDEESAASWTDLLEALGFTPVAEVCKMRRKAEISWQDRQVEASLDQVDGLGNFVELELVVDPKDVDAARECILSLATAFGLAASERRSYLELLTKGR